MRNFHYPYYISILPLVGFILFITASLYYWVSKPNPNYESFLIPLSLATVFGYIAFNFFGTLDLTKNKVILKRLGFSRKISFKEITEIKHVISFQAIVIQSKRKQIIVLSQLTDFHIFYQNILDHIPEHVSDKMKSFPIECKGRLVGFFYFLFFVVVGVMFNVQIGFENWSWWFSIIGVFIFCMGIWYLVITPINFKFEKDLIIVSSLFRAKEYTVNELSSMELNRKNITPEKVTNISFHFKNSFLSIDARDIAFQVELLYEILQKQYKT